MDAGLLEARKARARTWFETLRDDICAAFEALEAALPAGAPLADRASGPIRSHALDSHRSRRRPTDLGFTRDRQFKCRVG